MAFSTITDTEIQPGKPGSSALFTKLRDNPIAIANGDSGAPKVQRAGINDDAVDFASKIDDTKDSGTLNGSASAYTIVPKGVVNLVCTVGSVNLQIFVNSAWRTVQTITTTAAHQVVSDGLNVRVGGFVGTNTCAYLRIFK